MLLFLLADKILLLLLLLAAPDDSVVSDRVACERCGTTDTTSLEPHGGASVE